MSLIVWSTADTPLLKDVFGKAFKRFKPPVEHSFAPHLEDDPPVPETGDVVLVCGSTPLKTLQKAGITPKGRTVTSMREKPVQSTAGGYYLSTFDPASVMSEPQNRIIIDWDLRLAHRLMTTGSTEVAAGSCKYVPDFVELITGIKAEFKETGKPVDVAVDTETMGFDPWYDDKDIVSISFTHKRGEAHVLYTGPKFQPIPLNDSDDWTILEQIQWLLTSPEVRIRAANGKYDMVWIAEKWGIECTNFVLDTMLVGSLIDETRSNSLNLHAKIYTAYGGYDCVGLGTKLLTDDLLWKPVEDFVVGDKLLAFDENPVNGNKTRRLRDAVVEATKVIQKPCVRITLDNGVSLVCSTDHMFLSVARSVERGGWRWCKAHDLRIGSKLRMGVPAVAAGTDFDAGWMSGFLDGEGYVSKSGGCSTSGDRGFVLGWSQKDGPVHQNACRVMAESGFNGYGVSAVKGGTHNDVLTVKCGQWPSMGALLKFRPARLLGKKPWIGATIPAESAVNCITGLEFVGVQDVVALKTSTATFIAEGVCSHNSHFNATEDKGHMERIPPDKLLPYAGGDTIACQDVADVLKEELLDEPALANFYVTILHPAARAFEKIERRGLLIDQNKYAIIGHDLRKTIKEQQAKALACLPNAMRIKYKERIQDQIAAGKNPLLPSILKEFFFTPHGLNLKPLETTEKTGEPSMTKAHLRRFEHVSAAKSMVEALTEMDSASKTLSTFVDGFLKHLRPDGRFHPTYFLAHGEFDGYESIEAGTVSGRLSARSPAIQTLPKHTKWSKRLRECFIAPQGKTIINADFSQGELRVVACVSDETTMLDAYAKGLDLHAVTGAGGAQVPIEEFMTWKNNEYKELADKFDLFRFRAKAQNFGLVFGLSAEGFQAYAWSGYGLKLSLDEAKTLREQFFTTYPKLLDYHADQKRLAHKFGQVSTPLGRIRHLPHIYSWDRAVRAAAERQAINCLSDDTEILTAEGWRTVDQVTVGDLAYSVDPGTGLMTLEPITAVNVGNVSGRMFEIDHNSVSAIATPNHRWLVDRRRSTPTFKTSEQLTMSGDDKLWIACQGVKSISSSWTDDEVELLGWVLTDGYYKRQLSPSGVDWSRRAVGVTQSKTENVAEISALFTRLGKHSHKVRKTGQHVWQISSTAGQRMRELMPSKTLSMEVLRSLSRGQLELLFVTMLKGDGCWDAHAGRWRKFCAGSKERADAFMMLCSMIGQPARAIERDYSKYTPKQYQSMNNVPKSGKCWLVELVVNNRAQPQYGSRWIEWSGRVWCPTLKHGTWVAKRNGKVFITGNSPIQGCLTDMLLWAVAILEDAYPDSGLEIVATIHDALMAYVPTGEEMLWAKRITEVMSSLPFHEVNWEPQLVFPADAEAGPNLAAMKDLKLVV